MPSGSYERTGDFPETAAPEFLPLYLPKLAASKSPNLSKSDQKRPRLLSNTLDDICSEIEKLVDNCTDLHNNRQFSFEFFHRSIIYLDNKVTNLASYLRPSLHPIMGLSFCSLVVKQPQLRRIAQELYNAGIIKTGDVLQLTAEEIQKTTHATREEIDDLEGYLRDSELRLRLGVRIVGWQRSYPGSGNVRS